MNELALFAGAGGGILGGAILGWKTVCAVEIDAYCASVLIQRQNDGILTPFPIWDDVCTFDGKPWEGIVDVVSGGFPCQDISAAGKGAGIEGDKSGLWVEMARIISEVRPRYVFVENSPMLTSRGLGKVLGDLAQMGYDARWGVVSAANVGAPHIRQRIWIVADSDGELLREQPRRWNGQGRTEKQAKSSDVSEEGISANIISLRKLQSEGRKQGQRRWSGNGFRWEPEPGVGRVVYGVPAGMDRIKALGNGQVPQCMAEAWRRLNDL